MQQENMKTLESLEDFRHFSEKELEIRFDQLKKQIVPAYFYTKSIKDFTFQICFIVILHIDFS